MIAENDFPYVGINMEGHRFNSKYPPDEKRYGTAYGGYANNARQVLFYDFAVQGYDVEFKYKGKKYHILYEKDHSSLCDENFSIEYKYFANPIELIQELRIEGKPLVEIIDDLEDVDPL